MYQVIEKDWKLFRKLLPDWQEAYMERLVEGYKELLNSDKMASEKFWELDKQIKNHKRHTGVLARDVKRLNMFHHILNLLYEEAITKDDLADFSEELRDAVEAW